MKIYKFILTLIISIAFVGCASKSEQPIKDNINEVPNYEYFDNFLMILLVVMIKETTIILQV